MSGERKPLVGITSSMSDNFIRMNKAYFNAVYAAGGIPVFLPFAGGAAAAAKYAADFDGFLFAGGVDVAPARYGEEVTGNNVEVSEARDEFEFALFDAVKCTGKPILGICRGIQFLNVACGGSLYQDIPEHSQSEPGDVHLRPVGILPDSLLYRTVGSDTIFTNSFHHQSVKTVAPGLRITARTPDGSAEALEIDAGEGTPKPKMNIHRFFLGVQWHPELFAHLDTTSSAIFDAFVAAAKDAR